MINYKNEIKLQLKERWVLRSLLNSSVLEDNLIFSGSLFQSCDADIENVWEPYDAKQNHLGCSRKVEDERRFLTGAYCCTRSDR